MIRLRLVFGLGYPFSMHPIPSSRNSALDEHAAGYKKGCGPMLAPLTTVELFSGIGGFRRAADGIGLHTLWANDSSPAANTIYRRHFGDSVLVQGDITDLWREIPRHDLLTAGFPCQPFSSAGHKRGIGDARGTLFHVIADVLEQTRPPFFLLENVKRLLSMDKGTHFATILERLLELDYAIEWRLLNAADFGLAQNRWRVAILGTRRTQQERPLIRLASLEDMDGQKGAFLSRLVEPRSWVPIARYGKRFPKWGLAEGSRFLGTDLSRFSEGAERTTLARILETNVSPAFDFTEATLERIESSTWVDAFLEGVHILYNQGGGARMGYTIFDVDGLSPTLTSTASRHYERYRVGDRYRRLTPNEYARLQGFPDEYCAGLSLAKQYALYGNAVPPPLASWAISRISVDGLEPQHVAEKAEAQLSLATL